MRRRRTSGDEFIMMERYDDNSTSMREGTRRQLNDVRRALLHLHRVLLDIERRAYERVHGRVSAGELLELLIRHEQFAWLHVISELVVRIDELLDGEEPAEEDDAHLLMTEARSALVPAESGTGFAGNYFLALQGDPGAILAHRAVSMTLAAGVRSSA